MMQSECSDFHYQLPFQIVVLNKPNNIRMTKFEFNEIEYNHFYGMSVIREEHATYGLCGLALSGRVHLSELLYL
jgi:hypothetical protein